MRSPRGSAAALVTPPRQPSGDGLLESALAGTGTMLSVAEFRDWMAWRRESGSWRTTRIDLNQLEGWAFDDETGNLRHHSGKFFTIEGLAVRTEGVPAGNWAQPIIHQNEIGILGILVKRIDGILHCLMQAKMEPGNINQLQLSPTVQATRSNYMRVHNGSSIPYLEYFSGPRRGRILVDVLQSEQGAWFNHKRNRNMVVEVTEDVPVLEDFCWLTVGQVRQLLATDDLVNMPARTVLSSMPLSGPTLAGERAVNDQSFGDAVAYSLSGLSQSLHSTRDLISWFNEAKTRNTIAKTNVPLDGIPGWHRGAAEIARDDGRFFRVIAVSVDATTREVRRWSQPMVEPVGLGTAGFLAKRINGVVHVLVRASLEPGYLDAVEMAPTVHYLAGRYAGKDGTETEPPFLSDFLTAQPSQVRFDAVQSEEGGRFYHARNRYLIVEVDPDYAAVPPPDYCWASVAQLAELVAHSRYLNVEARTLAACLNSLW